MTLLNRRDLLSALSMTAAGLSMATPLGSMAFASAEGEQRFVFIILRGGVDGLAMVEPRGDTAFAGLRSRIAAANPLRLDGFFALHPSLSFVHSLYEKGQARIHHATGTGYVGRSHFDAQNILESGGNLPFALKSGWLNRLLPLLPNTAREAIAVGQNVPLALAGPTTVGSYKASAMPSVDADLLDRLDMLYGGDAQLRPIWDKARSLPLSASDEETSAAKSTGTLAAMLLSAQRGARIATIEMTGWDTHASQNGRLSGRLRELDKLLSDLHTGLGPLWQNTLVLVASEFGRTAALNGTNGTDHGTGSAALWLGGQLQDGGRVVADWPGLTPQSLFEQRDLRTTRLLQPVISAEVARHFGVSESQTANALFPRG